MAQKGCLGKPLEILIGEPDKGGPALQSGTGFRYIPPRTAALQEAPHHQQRRAECCG